MHLRGEALAPAPFGVPTPAVMVAEAGLTAEVQVTAAAPGGHGATVRCTGLPEAWHTLTPAPGRDDAWLLLLHPPFGDVAAARGEYPFALAWGAGGSPPLPCRLRVLPPGGTTMRSRMMEYLPGIFRDRDPFMARFLLIFQSVLDPMEHMITTTDLYLHPDHAPARFLPWLATWVGAAPDPGGPEGRQRRRIALAAELSAWKGTRRGLRAALELETDRPVFITENFTGTRLGADAAMGLNAAIGRRAPGVITVTVLTRGEEGPDPATLNAVIEEWKPAFARHELRVVTGPGTN